MENKTCNNCKYFQSLYIKDGIHFKAFTSASCTNLKADADKVCNDCKFWESRKELQQQNKEDIFLIIKDTYQRLTNIESYLNSEK